jgi:hypothetical protein
MKKILLTLTSVLFCAITFAQSVPQGINYQAVARDANGDVLMNQALTIQFSVIADIADTTNTGISWQETHTVSTNDYGLFTAIIGNGTTTGLGFSATFDVTDWGTSNHLLKVEVDYGSGLVDMGTTAFMSVPYAMQAENGSKWISNGSDIYYDNGYIGSGTTYPQHRIHVIESTLSSSAAIKGEGIYGPTYGYLGVQGQSLIGGTSLSNYGQEIGVLGISEGTSNTDNYGVFGYSNYYGGGFESTSGNKAELGGNNYAGYFTGDVNIVGNIYNTSLENTIDSLTEAILRLDSIVMGFKFGCIDPTALNYDSSSTITDNTCEYLSIGDYYEGGVIFYIDSTGLHGLICDINDLGIAEWGCYMTSISTGTAIGTGSQNTMTIINANCSPQISSNSIAANLCGASNSQGYSDWFLPSKDEMLRINQNHTIINATAINNGGSLFNTDSSVNFLNPYYWTSSEYSANMAWSSQCGLWSTTSNAQTLIEKDVPINVRAVRAF